MKCNSGELIGNLWRQGECLPASRHASRRPGRHRGRRVSGWAVGLVWLGALLGCAAPAPGTDLGAEDEAERSLESILTQPTVFSETERCLRSGLVRDIQILDERHLVFVGRRGEYWVNVLPQRCVGLDRLSRLHSEQLTTPGNLCRLDTFAVTDEWVSPWSRSPRPAPAPRCALGDFQPLTSIQLQLLKDNIAASKR